MIDGQAAYQQIDDWAFQLTRLTQQLFRTVGQNVGSSEIETLCADIALLAINVSVMKKMIYGGSEI